jgi:hypothetical protein
VCPSLHCLLVRCRARPGYGLHTGHAILERSNASRWPAGSTLYSLALLRGLSSTHWSPGEQQELLARRLMLLRYLLRSPCYTMLTRCVRCGSWAAGLSRDALLRSPRLPGVSHINTCCCAAAAAAWCLMRACAGGC